MLTISKKEDYQKIIELGTNINSNFSNLYPLESLYNDFTKIIIYKVNNEIVGFIHYELLYETCSLYNVIVSKEFENQGIGSSLMNYMIEDSKKSNIDNIILEVKSTNEKAINLYKKYDFNTINIRPKYYDGIDAYIMERRI